MALVYEPSIRQGAIVKGRIITDFIDFTRFHRCSLIDLKVLLYLTAAVNEKDYRAEDDEGDANTDPDRQKILFLTTLFLNHCLTVSCYFTRAVSSI